MFTPHVLSATAIAGMLSIGMAFSSLTGAENAAAADASIPFNATPIEEACSSASNSRIGPCGRMGCSGRDQYCKSYVVFDLFGLTLYRHCTGTLGAPRERQGLFF